MNALAKLPVRMTVEQFLLWADATPGRWELVDGVPRPMTPPLVRHGVLQSELIALLRNHLASAHPECFVVTDGGVVPRMLAEINMRVPELAVSCTASDLEGRAIAHPVLIAEILSPSNAADTWNNVWAYTTIDSLREILVLRADRVEAELLRRDASERWPAEPARVTEGDLVLDSLHFRTPLADLYRTTRLTPR